MSKQVFIINGSGGTGKDQFVKDVYAQSYRVIQSVNSTSTYIKRLEVGNYSSVDKVKKLAEIIGWNGGKTERDRKFLSDLKLLTTEYNDMPLKDMKEFAYNFMNCEYFSRPRILFLHIREPEEIVRAIEAFKEYNAKTILVRRDSVEHITSNMADANVYNYDYDIVIYNNGRLEELTEKAKSFVDDYLNNCLKKEY